MEATNSSLYIRLIPPDKNTAGLRRKSDTDKDAPLLESLLADGDIGGDTDDPNDGSRAVYVGRRLEQARRKNACTGRFLTMHKRRRKKLQTRALLRDPAMLDDVLHGQVQCILNQAGNWRFNAFTLETVTGGRSLPVLCVHLFHIYGLLDEFRLDVVRLWKLFSLIEEGYHSTNPYHNSIHATDVTQAMHCFLQESAILQHMQPIEIMASLLGAVTHDLDHPGVNQPFLIATSNHLAALYENTSVLENHHWRSAVGCLLESGVAEQIRDIRPQLEQQIASLILATDITRQQEFLAQFRRYMDTGTLDMRLAEHRHFILQIALKSADISNPCRPWDVSKKWSHKVCEEFFRQGDYERQLNLPVTGLCDRYTTSVSKIQVGFFKFVVTPLFDEWHRFLDSPLSRRMMRYLKYNQVQWETRVAAELAEETRTEISDIEVMEAVDDVADADGMDTKHNPSTEDIHKAGSDAHIDDDDDDDDDGLPNVLSDSSEVLLPSKNVLAPSVFEPRRNSLQIPTIVMSRFDRRHSVPVTPLLPNVLRPHHELNTRRDDAIGEEQMAQEPPAARVANPIRFDADTLSLLSSDGSGSFRRKNVGDRSSDHVPGLAGAASTGSSESRQHLRHHCFQTERPLSAETLVPDLSIATMSDCADRLNVVLHGSGGCGAAGSCPGTNSAAAAWSTGIVACGANASNKLIRQQTFPPVQPYVRARYMSAAADMGACTELTTSGSTSAAPSDTDLAAPFEPVTTAAADRLASSLSYGGGQTKRENKQRRNEHQQHQQCAEQRETAAKMAKLSFELGNTLLMGQKENVDPTTTVRRAFRSRRSSAPVVVALPAAAVSSASASMRSEPAADVASTTRDRFGRRGSMPADIIGTCAPAFSAIIATTLNSTTSPCTTTSSSLLVQSATTSTFDGGAGGELNKQYLANVQLIPRRGSVPCEMLLASGSRGSSKQSAWNASRKKLLRRRSAGGTEILAPIFGDPLDVDIDDMDDATTTTTTAAAAAAETADAAATDSGSSNGSNKSSGGGGGCDATATTLSASAARFRLKRGSEVTLTRGLHQRGGSGNDGGGMEALLSRRRGSLPVEMLSISCSGNLRH